MAETGGQLQRICVLGCGGTGKSTLARLLGARLGLPVHHLDALIWQAGWTLPPLEKQIEVQRGIAEGERWVIDGNWSATMPVRFARAQAIVWLDYPTWLAMWGVLRRVAHEKGRVRPDMAPGCTERWDWGFYKWVLEFRQKHRGRILEHIQNYGSHARLFHVTHRSQLAGLCRTLSTA